MVRPDTKRAAWQDPEVRGGLRGLLLAGSHIGVEDLHAGHPAAETEAGEGEEFCDCFQSCKSSPLLLSERWECLTGS